MKFSYYFRALFYASRPRFWLYTAGPYLVGYGAGSGSVNRLSNFEFWIWFVFFLFPVNILLYGINDWFDKDTDQLNRKKDQYEQRLEYTNKEVVRIGILFSAILFAVMAYGFPSQYTSLMLMLMLVLLVGYSVPPLRLKARPFVDSLSNVLYVLPGFIGYYQSTRSFPDWQIIIAVWCWSAAMHLLSAIPDIKPDSIAHLRTTAVVLGRRSSLWLCILLWGIFSAVFIISSRNPISLLLLVYPLIPAYLLLSGCRNDERVYRYFPIINTVFGFGLFLFQVL